MLIALKAFSERKPELSWLNTFLEGRRPCPDSDDAVVHGVMDSGTDACTPGEPQTIEEMDEQVEAEEGVPGKLTVSQSSSG